MSAPVGTAARGGLPPAGQATAGPRRNAFLATRSPPTGWRASLAAIAFGAFGALALPPVHAVPVLLIAVPGLLWLLAGARSWRGALALGFAWGWGHHLVGIHWVTYAMFTDLARWWWLVPLAGPGLALPMALLVAPAALAAWALPAGWQRVLGFALAFTLGEFGRGVFFTGFPWNLLGTAWAFAAFPLQPAALVGVHGLSLATAWIAGWWAAPSRPALAVAGLLLLAGAGLGTWRLAAPLPPEPGHTLVLVQGNVAQEAKWREDQRLPIFQRYLALTEAAAAAATGPTIVVWPETASPFLLAQDPEAIRLAAEALPDGATLLAGTVRVDWRPDGSVERLFNSLVGIAPDGRVLGTYDKAHLVPFGEYMPLAGLLPIRLVAGGMDFSAGPGPQTLMIAGAPPVSVLVCYEVIFAAAVTEARRPEWLLNVTNDAWFGFSAGPWQHLATARLRAVEEGLPLARAAQTGISAVFDAYGRRLAMLSLGETGTVTAPLPGALRPTLFARFGLWLPAGLLVLGTVVLVTAHLRVVTRR